MPYPTAINRVFVERRPFMSDEFEILLGCINHGSPPAYAEPVTLTASNPDDAYRVRKSTCALTDEAAQQLMDELWRCGLRPTEGSGSAGSLAATERHLEDMRALVFKVTPPARK